MLPLWTAHWFGCSLYVEMSHCANSISDLSQCPILHGVRRIPTERWYTTTGSCIYLIKPLYLHSIYKNPFGTPVSSLALTHSSSKKLSNTNYLEGALHVKTNKHYHICWRMLHLRFNLVPLIVLRKDAWRTWSLLKYFAFSSFARVKYRLYNALQHTMQFDAIVIQVDDHLCWRI